MKLTPRPAGLPSQPPPTCFRSCTWRPSRAATCPVTGQRQLEGLREGAEPLDPRGVLPAPSPATSRRIHLRLHGRSRAVLPQLLDSSRRARVRRADLGGGARAPSGCGSWQAPPGLLPAAVGCVAYRGVPWWVPSRPYPPRSERGRLCRSGGARGLSGRRARWQERRVRPPCGVRRRRRRPCLLGWRRLVDCAAPLVLAGRAAVAGAPAAGTRESGVSGRGNSDSVPGRPTAAAPSSCVGCGTPRCVELDCVGFRGV